MQLHDLLSLSTDPRYHDFNEKMKIILGNIKKGDKQSLEELEKYDNNSWKTVRNSLILLGVSFTVIGSYLIYESGRTKYNLNGDEIVDSYSDRSTFMRYMLRTLHELKAYQRVSNYYLFIAN